MSNPEQSSKCEICGHYDTCPKWACNEFRPAQPSLPQAPKEDWEERFDKEFPDFSDLPIQVYEPADGEVVLRWGIKHFIRTEIASALSQQEEKHQREIELARSEGYTQGFNFARDNMPYDPNPQKHL